VDQGNSVLEHQEDEGVLIDAFSELSVESEKVVVDVELLVVEEGRTECKGDSIVRTLGR
jgi:hypothetical protein